MPRRHSIDLGGFDRNLRPWLARLETAFSVVNPHGGRNPHGNCTTCAVYTADALVNGTTPREATLAMGNVVGGHEQEEFDEDEENRVWTELRVNTVLGGVYILDDEEDHVFNIVRHYNRGLYLIDTNEHNYAELRLIGDSVIGGQHYLNPGDEGMTLHYWGLLHNRWL